MTTQPVPLNESPLARIQREKREEREAGRAEGRAEWESHVQGAAQAAANVALASHKEALANERKQIAAHMRDAVKGGFWRGFGVGGVLMAALASVLVWFVAKDSQLTNAAARGIEQRGGPDIPTLTIRDPNDTSDRDSGYERPGREPASAR